MTFDVNNFAQQLNTKADLLLVANLFNVGVPVNAHKVEIEQYMSKQLVERGIIAKAKPQVVGASGGLMVEVGAEAATNIP